MKKELIKRLQAGQALTDLRSTLDGSSDDGVTLHVTVDDRALPYMNHVVSGWVDGPQPSNVVAVISGAAPSGDKWRRFSLTRTGAGRYEIDCFPTPFQNADAPLSPGIPPAGRTAH